MERAGQKRPWLAAALSLVYPGLGHLYLRSWLRSMMWFGLVAAALAVLLPMDRLAAADGAVPLAVAAWETLVALELQTKFLLAGIVTMEAFDAYLLALFGRGGSGGDHECPNCGRELDEDLAFCHWCTAPVEE
jgi:hypothetical protein